MARSGRRLLGIRARVVASFLVLLVTAEVVSVAVLHQVGEARMEEQADRELTEAAEDLRNRVEGAASADGPVAVPAVFEEFLRSRPARADQAYLTYVGGLPFATSAGSPVALAELDLSTDWAALEAPRQGTSTTSAGAMRWLAVPVVGGDAVAGVLVAVEFLDAQQAALRGTVVTVSVVTALVLVGACLLAWGVAGRALSPLHQLAGAARSVTSGEDLGARIDVSGGDEVGQLATSFNQMMDRLQGAFDSQKQFLDDAGHELRTPITVVRGHVELLDDDPEQRAEEVELVLDELDRMDRLVGELRLLARSQRPDFLEPAPVDARRLVEEIGRKASAVADRAWVVSPPGSATLRADRHRLTEAVLNVVDNAVQATGPGTVIEVAGELDDGSLRLSVRDEGPGIPPEALPRLFARTGRNVRHRPGGTGLGLPIAAAIAEAHGGRIGVDTTVGVGTCVTIEVPLGRGEPA